MTEEEMEALIEQLKADNEKLKADKQTAIGEKNRAKKTAEEALSASELAKQEAAEKSGDIETIKAGLAKAHKAEIDKLQADLSARDTRLSALLIDNTISEAINKNGVLPQFAPAVTALLKMNAKMDGGEAMADGVPLTDYVSTFFQSPDAAHYVAAKANSGAGAQGSSTAATGTITTVDAFMQLMKSNPAAAASANLAPELAYLKAAVQGPAA